MSTENRLAFLKNVCILETMYPKWLHAPFLGE